MKLFLFFFSHFSTKAIVKLVCFTMTIEYVYESMNVIFFAGKVFKFVQGQRLFFRGLRFLILFYIQLISIKQRRCKGHENRILENGI